MKAQFRLKLLGTVRVERDGRPVQGFESRKALALLAYLAVQGQPVPRSRLADLFWGDKPEASGRNNLSRVLSNLSTLLPGCLEADRYTVRLNPNIPFELDVAEFETKITQGDAASLAEAANLYRGDFMEGIYLDDCPGVEIWMVSERERRREQAAQALQTLVEHHAWRGQYQEGLAYTARLLALDPWREEAHRQKMLLLARTAQRSAALKQYDKCRRILAEELDVEPSHETKALYERIRAAGEQPRHNLPPQPTPFVGREDELAEIGRLLVNPDCRLWTLAGPGGIGKTRVALQAAGEKIGAFLQGVYFVPLAPVRSAEFLVSAIAEAIAFSFYSREAPQDQLVNYLREKEMLLVLDNFEHLLDGGTRPGEAGPRVAGGGAAGLGADLLVEILQGAPEVKLLVTSRERLNLREEWVLEVQSLPVPEGIDDPDLERYEAVRLFLQNVRKADL
ncbi:MAG: BTAD domain-containing putative transcriptional regulator, partial [Anaerolineales bacterium]